MKRISIERYKTPTAGYAGCIEGENDEGQQWIMFLDAAGTPEVFWPDRTPDGGVYGQAVPLSAQARLNQIKIREDKMRQILTQTGSPEAIVHRLWESLKASEELMRGERSLSEEDLKRVWEIRDEKIFGRRVSPEKPEHPIE